MIDLKAKRTIHKVTRIINENELTSDPRNRTKLLNRGQRQRVRAIQQKCFAETVDRGNQPSKDIRDADRMAQADG